MSKLEQVNRISELRSAAINDQINELMQLQISTVEILAHQLEPLAESMAVLTDETRQTLIDTQHQAIIQAQKWGQVQEETAQKWRMVADQLRESAQLAARQVKGMNVAFRSHTIKIYIVAIITALILSLLLLSAYMIWQPPLSKQEKAAVQAYHLLNRDSQSQLLELVNR